MRRSCDWCKNDADYTFMIPEPSGAVVPETFKNLDFCMQGDCARNAVIIMANLTSARPYPTSISFGVIDA